MEEVENRDLDSLEEPVVRALAPFDAFYSREYDHTVRLALALSGSRWGSEDLAQEAFIEAHRRWDEIGRFDDPGAWVRRVVSNRSVSWYRRRLAEAKAIFKAVAGTRKALPALEPDSEEVWEAVRKLSKRQSQVVALTYLEDMSLEQIGELLDISVPTVGTHLQRGRESLAQLLRNTEEGSRNER
jgi:RNA polymerase sigma-70 factor (ECF subfamily)